MRDTKKTYEQEEETRKLLKIKTYKINTYVHRHNTVGAESTQEQAFLYGIDAIRI